MIGGPAVPGAPWWMWAARPCSVGVEIVPLTLPSASILMLPVPTAVLVLGGVSSAPVSRRSCARTWLEKSVEQASNAAKPSERERAMACILEREGDADVGLRPTT